MGPTKGIITYDSLEQQHADICIWYLNVAPEFHIQIKIDKLEMASGKFVNCSANSLEVLNFLTKKLFLKQIFIFLDF